jgi:hypothetical protein
MEDQSQKQALAFVSAQKHIERSQREELRKYVRAAGAELKQ